MDTERSGRLTRRIGVVAFVVYLLVLVLLTVLKFNGTFDELWATRESILAGEAAGVWSVNLSPLRTIGSYVTRIAEQASLLNLVGGIAAFIPLGMLMPFVWDSRNFFLTMLSSLVVLVAIEAVQFVASIGVFDVDDIIMGFAGALLGYLVHLIVGAIWDHARA